MIKKVRKTGRVLRHLPDSPLNTSAYCRETDEKIKELSASTVAFISCRSRLGWKLLIFSLGSLCYADVYRHESGRCRTLPFFLTFLSYQSKEDICKHCSWWVHCSCSSYTFSNCSVVFTMCLRVLVLIDKDPCEVKSSLLRGIELFKYIYLTHDCRLPLSVSSLGRIDKKKQELSANTVAFISCTSRLTIVVAVATTG